MGLLAILLVMVIVVVAVVWLYIVNNGNAEFDFLLDQRTDFKLEEMSSSRAVFSCSVPFVNKGKQDGIIMDCFPRHQLPQEQFDAVELASRIELESKRRLDGYFESVIIPTKTGSALIVTLIFTAKAGDIRQALAGMVDMSVDIIYQVYALSKWYMAKPRILVTANEIIQALSTGNAEV